MKKNNFFSFKRFKNNKGFTLLETLLAISIIAVVIVQTVSIEAASIGITQTTRNKMRAVWALRQMTAQVEYVTDALGLEALPRTELNVPWSGDDQFMVNLQFKDANIEASRLLTSAMKLAQGVGGETKEKETNSSSKEGSSQQDSQIKEFADLIDSRLPKDLFYLFKSKVTWKEGNSEKTLDGGYLIIDEKKVASVFEQAASAAKGAMGGANPTGSPSPSGSPGPTATPTTPTKPSGPSAPLGGG